MTPGNATRPRPVGPGMRENNAKSRRRERRKLASGELIRWWCETLAAVES